MDGFNICRTDNPVRTTLEKIQREISTLSAEIEQTERAYLPYEETRANLLHFLKEDQYQRVPEKHFESFQSPFSRNWELPRELSLVHLAYLMGPDALVDRIMERIGANGQPVGLPAAERQKKLAELQAKLRRLMESEEVETLRIEKLGWVVLRREDADVQVILDVWAQQDA